MTRIAHLDIDAFFASVELLDNPALVGKPVIVAHNGPRAVVTTATYEARAFGIGSGMAKRRALQLCPQVEVIQPNLTRYRELSQAVMRIIRSHSSQVQVLGLDEAYVDLSELLTPIAAVKSLARDIKTQTGLTVSVGVGPNKLLAKIASGLDKPNGMVQLNIEEAKTLFADKSPSFIPGIGPKTTQRLATMNVRTIGELQQTPVQQLMEVFGQKYGQDIAAWGKFQSSTKLEYNQPRKSESCERTFDEDISAPEKLMDELTLLVKSLVNRLQKHSLQGRTVTIKMRTADFQTFSRSHSFGEPTAELTKIAAAARQLFYDHFPQEPIRLLGIRVSNLQSSAADADTTQQLTLDGFS